MSTRSDKIDIFLIKLDRYNKNKGGIPVPFEFSFTHCCDTIVGNKLCFCPILYTYVLLLLIIKIAPNAHSKTYKTVHKFDIRYKRQKLTKHL